MGKSVEKSAADVLHKKAEGLLEKKQLKTKPQNEESDILKLLHELQVHQIELELQHEELILAKEQADIATEKYTELYDFAPTGYYTLSREGEILELNLTGAKMLGKDRSRLKNSQFSYFVSNNSKPIFNFFVEKVFTSNTAETCEVTLSVNDKLLKYVYLTGIAKENKEQCLLTVVDISECKQMEIDLVHAKESDRLKTAFLQNMSHEIRTPMNSIKGFSELLIKNSDDKLKCEKYSHIIKRRCDDLLEIINDILDVAKIESGQMPVYLEECELIDLFEELDVLGKEYQQQIGKPHIKFKTQVLCDLSGSIIVTDTVKLKQIFINLITNAFKFTDTGSIEAGCKFENNNLVFYVSDTGIGIPADKHRAVFERFVQLKQDATQIIGGTGLGLAIAKGLVSLLGGEIFLESEPNKGSTFYFIIPDTIKRLAHQTYSVSAAEESKQYHFSHKTILVVEDESFNVEYLKEVLTDAGLDILIAETGKEAIQKATSQAVELVLMDIRLPDMEGYEVLRHIRQHKPDLKIIAQTAYASIADKQRAFDLGFNDFISKPMKVDSLLSLLNRYLS